MELPASGQDCCAPSARFSIQMCLALAIKCSLCAAWVRAWRRCSPKKASRPPKTCSTTFPFRYEDRQNPRSLDELKPGEVASVIGEVRGSVLLRTRRMPLFELTVGQGRFALKCIWFNAPYLNGKFQAGQTVAVYGKVEPSRSTSNFKMIQPQFEILPDASDDAETRLLEVGRITPVYESLGGSRLASRWQRKVIFNLLEGMRGAVPECLPQSMLRRLDLPDRETALREVHFPPEGTPFAQLQSSSTPAHRRLIFEELFFLELGLELKRRRMKERKGIAFATNDKVREAIREVLPFHPTAAQKRALGEIVADMRAPSPMRRLLQGDVGSGKTIVAFQAMLVAMENGYQAALMAPTEILATQHFLAARKLLERSSRKPRIVLLTGSLDEDRKRTNRGLINRGEANLVIGTHALIEEKVEFDRLGLVVVDEQHRFGVLQRFKLMKKPNQPEPDVLVMTATPIPRTLALSLYGDLDLSVLDEMPPGRMPIVTRRVPGERAEEVWDFVRKQVAQGRQAYIVYPVIEGTKDDQPELDFSRDEAAAPSDLAAPTVRRRTTPKAKTAELLFPASAQEASPSARSGLRSAVEMHEKLRTGPFAGLRVGLLHGRLDADEKEVIMRRFQRGEIDVLVSTTVIEVGVDVANATRDGGGARGALRAGAVAPVARARGPRRGQELLHPDDRRARLRARRRAAERDGAHAGRIRAGRAGSLAARAGRVFRHAAGGLAGVPRGQSPARPAIAGAGQAGGGAFCQTTPGPRSTEASAPACARNSSKPGSGDMGWLRRAEPREAPRRSA